MSTTTIDSTGLVHESLGDQAAGGTIEHGVDRSHLLGGWLPALEGVEDTLRAGAMVADVACGHGLSTILMARAFPRSAFTGYDLHDESIATARRRARECGATRNVRFEVADATAIPTYAFDLVTTFGALHHMGDPAAAARRVRDAIADDGTWMIVEPRAGDALEDDLTPAGRFWYASSTLLGTPGSLAQEGGAGLGAQAGPARLEALVREAGFTRVRLAAQTPFTMVLEVRP
jgi:SAM-dependent methyltransferase